MAATAVGRDAVTGLERRPASGRGWAGSGGAAAEQEAPTRPALATDGRILVFDGEGAGGVGARWKAAGRGVCDRRPARRSGCVRELGPSLCEGTRAAGEERSERPLLFVFFQPDPGLSTASPSPPSTPHTASPPTKVAHTHIYKHTVSQKKQERKRIPLRAVRVARSHAPSTPSPPQPPLASLSLSPAPPRRSRSRSPVLNQ